MNKFVGYAMLMLAAGAAMGAVSQQVLVSRRVATDPVVATDHGPAPLQMARTMQPPGERVVAAHAQRKPMPADPAPPAPTTTGWATALDAQSYELVPELQWFVIKTLDLPPGEYLVTATVNIDTTTNASCLLGWEFSEGLFPELDSATAMAHIQGSAEQVKTLQRITLQAGRVFANPAGGTMGLVCMGGNNAMDPSTVSRPQITAHRVALAIAP